MILTPEVWHPGSHTQWLPPHKMAILDLGCTVLRLALNYNFTLFQTLVTE